MTTEPSAELWRPVVGYEGLYEVSSHGRVRSLDRRVTRKDGITRDSKGRALRAADCRGYPTVALCGVGRQRTFRISWLVAAAFIGPRPDRNDVAHWNGRSSDSHWDNLVYETRLENNHQKKDHGTWVQGSKHPNAKLSEALIPYILKSPLSNSALGAELGVAHSTIFKVRNGKRWSHALS